MKLIVGLGNPGREYESTRHNIGFMVVDRLSHELGTGPVSWETDTKKNVMTAKIGDVLLVKPLTFMNASGFAVRALVDFYKLAPTDVWVIHDDMDLPLGKIRIREKGGTAGHNGVDSILQQLKSDLFVRFRLGIGRGGEAYGRQSDKNLHHRSVIQFVLSRFHQGEAGDFRKLIKHGTEAVRIALIQGIDKAMNRFN
ncbi:aminoacyl-tRNA hydrolase [Candidatus Gottesmanbacteria bacterium]|nr:aminoacyl-tRNA hydrolase [Candidatus Gottesmanbacteria bacterium]